MDHEPDASGETQAKASLSTGRHTCHACNKPLVGDLEQLEERALAVKAGKSRSYVEDAQLFAEVLLTAIGRIRGRAEMNRKTASLATSHSMMPQTMGRLEAYEQALEDIAAVLR